MKETLKATFKAAFWILSWILFPILTGLYFILPGKIFKNKMSKELKIFCWVIYAFLALPCVVIKIIVLCYVILLMSSGYDDPKIEESVTPASYRTSEDFYKLTGVKFPELEIVDSLYYDDGWHFPSNYWNEYKFVVKGGQSESFYKRLKRACKTDSTHWNYTEDGVYKYGIFPDSTPVDRSRGMCDRMIELRNGNKLMDCMGSFISVEIHNDTIVLQEGNLR